MFFFIKGRGPAVKKGIISSIKKISNNINTHRINKILNEKKK